MNFERVISHGNDDFPFELDVRYSGSSLSCRTLLSFGVDKSVLFRNEDYPKAEDKISYERAHPFEQTAPDRQSASAASHAPPRMTFVPCGFEAGPWGSVVDAP
jgi:hypothetical protein